MEEGRVLVVLRGVSGSGKTATARTLGGTHCSSDDFFIDEKSGEYNWNQTGLRKAHVWNAERCRIAMERGDQLVVIDNCNLSRQDAAPYVGMAMQHHYRVKIVDCCGDVAEDSNGDRVAVSAKIFADRNVHQVPLAAIEEQFKRLERYTVNDVVAWLKEHQDQDSKEVKLLRARYRENLLTAQAEPGPGPVTEARSGSSSKVRIEVCKNDGQANPCKPLIVSSGDSLASIMEQACKKVKVGYNAKKCTLFDVRGSLIERVAFDDGQRVVVSHDGKAFVEIQVKKSAVEKREAKLRSAEGSSLEREVLNQHAILAQMGKLSSGASLIVDGIFIGSGRDGRDVEIISQMDTIVNVAKEWPALDEPPRNCKYVHLGILDEPHQYLESFLPAAISAMDSATRVLVHCIRGASRSAAIVCCYLVLRKGYSSLHSIELVCEKRSQVCMNPFFVVQIAQLQAKRDTAHSIPRLLLADRLNLAAVLDGFARRLEGPEGASHVLKAPPGAIRKDEYFLIPSGIRNAVFQLATEESSRLAEVPCGYFRFHVHLPHIDLVERARKALFTCGIHGEFTLAKIAGSPSVRLTFPSAIVKEADWRTLQQDVVAAGIALQLNEVSAIVQGTQGDAPLEACSIFPGPEAFWSKVAATAPTVAAKVRDLHLITFLNKAGKDAAQLVCKQYGIKLSRHAKFRQLHQFTYSSRNSMLGDPLVGECRGIVVERVSDGNWRAVALPFLKFFNLGDDRAKDFDWKAFHTFEKLDGMMVMLYAYQDEWQVATQSVPDGSNTVGEGSAALSVRDLFLDIFASRGYQLPSASSTDDIFVFELLSRKCQVVVSQGRDDDLVLIGVRDMKTLRERDSFQVAREHGWSSAPRFHMSCQEEVVQRARLLTGTLSEGFVVCDAHWNRLKVKAPSYVAIFHLKGSSMEDPSAEHMLPIVLSGEEDEVAIYFPHLKEQLHRYAEALVRLEDALTKHAFEVELPMGQTAADFVRSQPAEVVARWLQGMLPADSAARENASDGSASRMSKAEKQAQKAQRKAERKGTKKK